MVVTGELVLVGMFSFVAGFVIGIVTYKILDGIMRPFSGRRVDEIEDLYSLIGSRIRWVAEEELRKKKRRWW